MEREWGRLVEAVLHHDLHALARLASRVEDRTPGWRQAMRALMPHTGKARVIGITGPPGSGKSTLTGHLAACFSARGWDVAVIAVDPSSVHSGGALLGDRLRMTGLDCSNVFVRSLASRGAVGGLSQAARDLVRILDAFGKTLILLETVGAGQDDVDVADVADIVAVLCVPGLGDHVQAVKSGIMEIGDVFVVNKMDVGGADQVAADILQAIRLRQNDGTAVPGLMRTTASRGLGVTELADVLIERLHRRGPERAARRMDCFEKEVAGLVMQELRDLIRKHPACGRLRERFASDETIPLDPYEFYDVLFSGGPWMDLQNKEPDSKSVAGAHSRQAEL